MNTFETVLIALALIFNSWGSYLNAGIILTAEKGLQKAQYVSKTFVLQFIMAGTGIWLGFKLSSIELQYNMMISMAILFIFGLKVLMSYIKSSVQEKTYDYTDNKVTVLAALADGITPLAVCVSIGLLSLHPYLHWMLIGILFFVAIVAGLFTASRIGARSLQLRVGPIGGILLLAAAFKLAINLIGF